MDTNATMHINTTAAYPLTTNGTLHDNAFGHNLSASFSQTIGSCFLVIIIVAVVCNVILIASIVLTKKLHTVHHIFIVNLALCDLITAVGSISFDAEYMFRGYFPHGRVACGIMNTVFLISLPSSVLSLTLLTAERLIVVVFPYKVKQLLTRSKIGLTVTIVWIYVLIVALFPIMYNKDAVVVLQGNCYTMFPLQYNVYLLTANFAVPIIMICGANILLLTIAQKHCRKQSKRMSSLSGSRSNSTLSCNSVNLLVKYDTKKVTPMSKNFKAAKRVALLVGVFLVCWLSYIIIVASNFICMCNPRELTWIGNVINYSSTAINPVLYGLLNKKIRQEVWKKARRYLQSHNIFLRRSDSFNAERRRIKKIENK